ncbi:hypothetical protein [Embleya sp. NPDC005575]|uniref:hypothetical protein n=1 Tax=Embleya sp. NPDC005575 TaxID=3156892 RepID=UPI0033A9B5DB
MRVPETAQCVVQVGLGTAEPGGGDVGTGGGVVGAAVQTGLLAVLGGAGVGDGVARARAAAASSSPATSR